MKKKSMALLLVFCVSLLPFGAGYASKSDFYSLDDTVQLMYLSDVILLDESELDITGKNPGLFSVSENSNPVEPAGDLLNRMIHSTKMERNDLDANCRLLLSRYNNAAEDCEAQKIQSHCEQQRTKLTNRISLLRKLRGDRRKALTKLWHSIKRGSANIWQKIGPVGRNFLRRVGPEALQVVASGGTLSGGVLKNLVKHTARSVGRDHLKQAVLQGVDRLLQGQLAIASAAGVDICATMEADHDEEVNQNPEENKGKPTDESCSSDISWVNEYWEEVVMPILVEENRSCQTRAVTIYKSCLQDQAIQGICLPEAAVACEAEFQAIPLNDGGGSVSLSPSVLHGSAEDVATSFTYPSSGGAVSGQFKYVMKDMHVCTISVTSNISGSYDPRTCSMSGTAQLTYTYTGTACASVCGSGPDSEVACPLTLAGTVPWQATLEDGMLRGGIGGDDCDPGCFGFQTGP